MLLFVMWGLVYGLLRTLSEPITAEQKAGWLTLIQLAQVDYELGQQGYSLHQAIKALQELQVLDLSSQRLAILPSEIGELHNLRALLLFDNQLAQLPPEIGQLDNLQSLELYE